MASQSGPTEVINSPGSKMQEIQKIVQNMDAPQRRTIQAAGYLSVKHALPKTCINHTIIHENPCQERVLNIELDRIRRRRKNYNSVYEISRRTFLDKQSRKQRKWKQQDQIRIASMNFPTVQASAIEGRASVEVMYKSPRYSDSDKSTFMGKPLLPYMILRRERTEFVKTRNKIATTRLPDIVEMDSMKLKRYNTYCGEEFTQILRKEKQNDKRFEEIIDSLSPLKSPPPVDETNPNIVPEPAESVDDGTRYWFMEDDMSVGSVLRGESRDSTRKATVVFPAMTRSKTMPAVETNSRRPSLDRERTQYDIKVKNQTSGKQRVVVEIPDKERSTQSARSPGKQGSSPDTLQLTSPQRKSVEPGDYIITEVKDGSDTQPARRGILKSPKKAVRSHNASVKEEKREEIKQDLQKKDLKELKEKYGPLKDVTAAGVEQPGAAVEQPVKSDPREQSSFHSPTMERRFSVKSATKKIRN